MSVDSATVTFAARNLDQQGVIRDLTLWPIISNMGTGRSATRWNWSPCRTTCESADRCWWRWIKRMATSFTSTLAPLPGALPAHLLYLVCPEERRGQWRRQKNNSVYECPCGDRWDVFPEDLRAMEEE